MHVVLYSTDRDTTTAADRMYAVSRYYDISSKADRGDIFIVQSKIIISHTPNFIVSQNSLGPGLKKNSSFRLPKRRIRLEETPI